MAKKKKQHDQSVSEDHVGFRDGVVKYNYGFEYMGNLVSHSTNEEEFYEVGQLVGDNKRIRNIQTNWMYGTKLTLIHLERVD